MHYELYKEMNDENVSNDGASIFPQHIGGFKPLIRVLKGPFREILVEINRLNFKLLWTK